MFRIGLILITGSYNLALDLIEPGSCKNPPSWFKNLKVYPDMGIGGHGEATAATPNSPGALHFTIGQRELMPPGWESKKMWIGWANQDKKIQVRNLGTARRQGC